MSNRHTVDSSHYYARIAGFGLLLMAILAMFANFSVIEGLIVLNDAPTTIQNILDHEMSYRAGLISFVIVTILDVLVAWTLYVLFKPVHKNLAVLAVCLRLVYTSIFAGALNHLLSLLGLLGSMDGSMLLISTEQLNTQTMLLIHAFKNSWLIGLVFFAFHLLVIGMLIIKSKGYLPKWIGIFLILAFLGYLLDSMAYFLLPNYTDYEIIFQMIVAIPGVIGELSLAFWLVLKGVKR